MYKHNCMEVRAEVFRMGVWLSYPVIVSMACEQASRSSHHKHKAAAP